MSAELKAIASLDGKPFEVGINHVKGQTDSFAKKLGSMKGLIAGAFSIGAITMFSRRMLTMADDLNTAANSVGITMESMLGLKSAMAESGIGAERMLKLLSRLPIAQGDVMNGLKTMTDALDGLKISQEEFVSLAPDELMERLAQAYADSGGSAEAFNGIAKIFGGRIGPEMIEVFQRLNKDGLQKYIELSKEASDGMTELANAADTLERFMNRVTLATGNFVSRLTMVKDAIYGAHKAWVAWAKEVAVNPAAADKSIMSVLKGGAAAEISKLTPSEQARVKQAETSKRTAETNIESLARKQMEADVKVASNREKLDKKISDMRAKQTDIEADYKTKRAEIMGGQGVPIGDQARVNNLQRMGGVVGGVAGAGDQAARIAERQAKAAEMVENLTKESLKKLDDIEKRIRELGE